MGTWIKPDVIYGDGSPVIPSLLPTVGVRGPRGKAGPQGERGEPGPAGSSMEIGGNVANAVFPKDADTFFGTDGELQTGLAGVLTGQLIGSTKELKYLTAVCNPVIADGSVTVKLFTSADHGQNWTQLASVTIPEGQRTATDEVNLTLAAGTLVCVAVNPTIADYTGPVSWLLHN